MSDDEYIFYETDWNSTSSADWDDVFVHWKGSGTPTLGATVRIFFNDEEINQLLCNHKCPLHRKSGCLLKNPHENCILKKES